MLKIDKDYQISKDIEFIQESEMVNQSEFSDMTKVSRVTLDSIRKNGTTREDILEKIYSYIYENKYRINSVKEELLKEKYKNVLFHGSKIGLVKVTSDGSRNNCDFGKGFYLGESYNQALSFVCEKEGSSIYSFMYSLDNLKVERFECDLNWMLTICYYRGSLKEYRDNKIIKNAIKKVEDADVVVAPIADNKMFYIMAQFVDGEINADVALHSLSASKLGLQYIFKTDKALKQLKPVEKYYVCIPERQDCIKMLNERSFEIDTKIKLAKREFKNGLYIEELLK